MIKQFAKLLIIASALSLAALPAVSAAKEPSCKQEAKKAGIKDKAEKKKYVQECEQKRKAAKNQKKQAAPAAPAEMPAK
jgi:hypothetical protein